MLENPLFDLFFAVFTCIGIVSVIWYFVGIALRKEAGKHNVFTVVLSNTMHTGDIVSLKRTLWYADNFTSDRVFFIAGCPDTSVKEELRAYCDSLYGTKLVERCELYDKLFQISSEDKQSK